MSDSGIDRIPDFEVSQDDIRFLKVAKCTRVGNSVKLTIPSEIVEIWGFGKDDTQFDILIYAMDVEDQGEVVNSMGSGGDPHIATILTRKILHKADFFERRSIDRSLVRADSEL